MVDLYKELGAEQQNLIRSFLQYYTYDNYGQSPSVDIDYLLRVWNENKQDLYQLLGKKFDIVKEIRIQKSEDEIENELQRIFSYYSNDSRPRQFRSAYYDLCDKLFSKSWGSCFNAKTLMSERTLMDNIFRGDAFEIPFPDGNIYKVNNGCKASKALGKIAVAFDLPHYEDFRIAHSQILNEKTVRGNLHLSIHPLDFLTASLNECGWNSCMDWSDGEYRRGVVEMMNSNSVICAWLDSSDHLKWGVDDKWNSKKWREFFVVSPNFLVGVKGYPYWNRNLETEVLNWLRELAVQNLKWDGYSETIFEFSARNYSYFPEFDSTYKMDFQCGPAMYNDMYDKHQAYITRLTMKEQSFFYSGPTECMFCGEVNEEYDSEGELACLSCIPVRYCTCCGDRLYEGDDYHEVDGEYYCYYCAQDLPRCSCCDDVHGNESMFQLTTDLEVEACKQADNGDWPITYYLCDDCIRDNINLHGESISHYVMRHEYRQDWNSFNYVKVKDMSKNLQDIWKVKLSRAS